MNKPPVGGDLFQPRRNSITSIRIIKLRANLGHQRAIAVGLGWMSENASDLPVIVMDSDGEDSPQDVPKLVEHFYDHGQKHAVFAARSKRSESRVFVVLYNCYKLIHLVLTGKPVKVGNFSIIPPAALHRAVVLSELWNHYAATMFKSRYPILLLATPRASRIAGKSTMNFYALVIHGLSGLSVFSELIGVRLLLAASVSFISLVAVLLVCLLLGFNSDTLGNIATNVIAGLFVVNSTVLFASLLFIFIILASRDSARFLPVRDYRHFIDSVEQA
jgi:hypothetical protein